MASPKTTSNVTVARVISPLVQLQVAGSRGEMGELTGAVDMESGGCHGYKICKVTDVRSSSFCSIIGSQVKRPCG